jgi:membrane protease YdiL (CAAX protease family)
MGLGQAGGVAAILHRRQGRLSDIGVRFHLPDVSYVLLGVVLQFGLAYLFEPLARAVDSDGTTQAVADSIASAEGLAITIAIIVLVGFVAPLMEETAFRGVLLAAVGRRLGSTGATVITAVVFSLFHTLGIQQDNWAAGFITLGQLFLVGLVLAILTMRSDRLGPAIFTHAGFNLVTLWFLLGSFSVGRL